MLFEKILRDREVEKVQRQRLLMPMLVELKPWQMVVFAQIAEELERNGFEVEPFGPQTLAVKAAPVGLEGAALERMLTEVIEQCSVETAASENLNRMKTLPHCARASRPPSPAMLPSRSIPHLTRDVWSGYCWNLQKPNTQPVARMDVLSLCCILGKRSSGPSTESER